MAWHEYFPINVEFLLQRLKSCVRNAMKKQNLFHSDNLNGMHGMCMSFYAYVVAVAGPAFTGLHWITVFFCFLSFYSSILFCSVFFFSRFLLLAVFLFILNTHLSNNIVFLYFNHSFSHKTHKYTYIYFSFSLFCYFVWKICCFFCLSAVIHSFT